MTGVEREGNGVAVRVRQAEVEERIVGSHLLVATGRPANVEGLGLEAAGVDYSPKGIAVDARLRTSNKRIYAIGDVAGGYQFTHMAAYHAGIVIRNALFKLPAKVDTRAVPWVTYTEPELAQVGLTEAMARDQGVEVEVLSWPFAENDRAQAERATEGFVKALLDRRGRIRGATIVGDQAGELIQPWVLAIAQGSRSAASPSSSPPTRRLARPPSGRPAATTRQSCSASAPGRSCASCSGCPDPARRHEEGTSGHEC